MLQADKADLKNQLRLRRLQIEEKELHFYAQSCSEVGTQAALLAGFAFGAMTEVDIDSDSSDAIQATWLFSICMAMLLEIGALVKAMQLSIHGPGLALRGPEGSVAHAIHVMREEYAYSKKLFYAGLFFFHVAVVVLTWSKFTSWAAGSISALVLAGLAWLVKETRSTAHRLKVPKHDGHAAWDPAAGQQQTWSADSDSGSLVVGREGARARAKRGSMFAELNRVKLRPRDSARHLIRQDERDEAQHEAQLWGTGQRKRGLLPGVKATLRRRAVGKASTAARAGAAPAVASKVACGGACGGPTHASHPPGSLDSRPPRPAASGGSPASARVASGDVAVARGGVLREDVQDELGAVYDAQLHAFTEVASLGGGQVLVDDDQIDVLLEGADHQILELAGSDDGLRVDARALLRHDVDDLDAGGPCQFAQLGDVDVEVSCAATGGHGDQNRSFTVTDLSGSYRA